MLRYPHQLDLPFDHKCVFERDGGTLLATKAVSVIQVALECFYLHAQYDLSITVQRNNSCTVINLPLSSPTEAMSGQLLFRNEHQTVFCEC